MWRKIFTVWKKELKDLFREKRTIIMTIVIPSLLMPAIMLASFYFQGKVIQSTAVEASKIAVERNDTITLNFIDYARKKGFIKEYVVVDDIAKAIEKGKVLSGIKAEKVGEAIVIDVFYKADKSMIATTVRELANKMKEWYVAEYLKKHGLPPVNILIKVASKAIGDPLAGIKSMVGFMLGMFIVMFAFVGNSYLGADIGAGEKERGTLLPLLASPADRKSIAIGKWLSLTTANIISTTALLAGQGIGLFYLIKFMSEDSMGQVTTNLLSMIGKFIDIRAASIIVFSALLLTIIGGAIQLIVSMWAKTFREAQMYLSQLGIIIVIPLIALMPSLQFASSVPKWSIFTPVVNTISLIYLAVMGKVTLIMLAEALSINIAVALILVAMVIKLFDFESIILRS